MIFPLVDGIGGTAAHITSHSINQLIAAVIDVVIILCCSYLLLDKALARLPESKQYSLYVLAKASAISYLENLTINARRVTKVY